MSKALLEIQNLHVRVEEKEILHGVDLTVGQDETHVLMGPNGTGKSTLGYAITGNPTYSVTGGSIIFNGEDITELPVNERAKKGIFLSFQTFRTIIFTMHFQESGQCFFHVLSVSYTHLTLPTICSV